MTQNTSTTAPVNLLAAISFYGSQAMIPIAQLRELLPEHGTLITNFVERSDELIKANQRRDEKRAETSAARNALIYVKSRINLDSLDRLRAAAEDPTSGRPLDSLHDLVKSMTSPEDMPVFEAFYIAALVSGHATTACREAERRAGEIRLSLSQSLGIA